MNKATVYVVLLNWNGWRDTADCLETLFASRGVSLRVVVCDNASSDGSLDQLVAWANGGRRLARDMPTRLARLLGKLDLPLPYALLDRAGAEQGRGAGSAPLVLVDNAANLGFAAGNNVGLRFALSQPDMDYVWILNNDTLVEPDCLGNMLRRLEAAPTNSVCGSMIHFFDQPDIIQAIGGNRFNHLTASAARSEGRFSHERDCADIRSIEARLNYVSGCSMLVPRRFLETVGLMSEDYFLYYEEIDWFTRAGDNYQICVAADARLYHREGAAIGSRSWRQAASVQSDYHMFRSRLIYMRKHCSGLLALCHAHCWLEVGKRLVRGQFRNAWTVASVLLGKQVLGAQA